MKHSLPRFSIRKAKPEDGKFIKDLIHRVGINPISLNWNNFILAVNDEGKPVGCGQIKPHLDGSHELASIAVEESYRKQGIATVIIRYLLKGAPRTIFLTCRESLGEFYRKFGFQIATNEHMTPYFRILQWATNTLFTAHLLRVKILVMVKPT